jgi:hypothetical protein
MRNTPAQMVELIVQVRAGILTATEAARRLGISRKTYYEREAKALQGMVTALAPGRPGRPPTTPDPEVARLRAALDQALRDQQVLEQRVLIQRVLAGADTRSKKKQSGARRAADPPATT